MSDPTAIPMGLDPQKQRMSGHARHGNTPFDVPYMTEIIPKLWQGGCRKGLILPHFIDVVISLYPWERYTIEHDAERFETVMYDSLDQAYDQVDTIAKQVNDLLSEGKTVLVHCQAGLNRSSLVVACALMAHGYTAKGAIKRIRTFRSPACLCNPSFEKYLLELKA